MRWFICIYSNMSLDKWILESAISDPVRLLAFMAAISCVLRQLATQSCLNVAQAKTKTDILTWKAHFEIE